MREVERIPRRLPSLGCQLRFDSLSDQECHLHFRFLKADVLALCDELMFPQMVTLPNSKAANHFIGSAGTSNLTLQGFVALDTVLVFYSVNFGVKS